MKTVHSAKIMFCLALFFVAFTLQAQKRITDFRFTSDATGWENDLTGVVDNVNFKVTFTTQRWIEDIAKLRATFILNGSYEVKVGENVQTSGVTENDFRKEVVYTIDGDVQYTVKFVSPQASGIPVMNIHTENAAAITSKENWTNIESFALTDPNDESYTVVRTGLSPKDRIRGRGNSTWGYPKKPYRVRFRQDVSLFGLAARENWILLAEFQDPTFLMNAIPFELGQNIFGLPFTCSFQHVQVYLNGNYDGLYVLTEHRQADPNGEGVPGRVNINVDGGWFIEFDSYYDEDPKFRTANYNLPVMIKSPESPSDPTNSNHPFYDFIKKDLNELCDSMASAGFPENGYRDLININSFVDYLMIFEIVLNGELYHPKSSFSYKGLDGKISMGPLWDFDWGFGYMGGHTYFSDYGNSSWGGSFRRLPKCSFFERFFDDPVFLVKYKERWNEKYDEIINFTEFIGTLGENLCDAATEDAKRWVISGGYWNDYDVNYARQILNMTNWWDRRMSYLDTEISKVDVLPASKNFGATGFGYSEVSPQIFTVVAFGELKDITAIFEKGVNSAFEFSAEIQIVSSGNGGYLATVGVQPKGALAEAAYSDVLIVNGENQGKPFSERIPLNFKVNKFTGTKNNPLEITTAAELAGLATLVTFDLDIHAKLMNDIDISGYKNWTPIGTAGFPFKGSFNGNYKKITGLNINDSHLNYAGLFGYNSPSADIQNLAIENAVIQGGNYTGAVAGYMNGGSISNCFVTGFVGGDYYVGGIVGFATGDCRITNCYATNEVTGTNVVGGVAGYLYSGRVINCVALNPDVTITGNAGNEPEEKLNRAGWTFPGYNANSQDGTIGYSSQATNEGEAPNGRVVAMIDGNPNTFWHACWSPVPSDYPHWFIVNLGVTAEINAVMLQRRKGDDRVSTGYRLFTCENQPSNPNDPENGYAWEYQGDFTFNPNIDDEQTNMLANVVKARYVKIYFDEKYEGTCAFAMIAEFGLYGPVTGVGRVVGRIASGTLSNNFADPEIGETSFWTEKRHNGRDGADVSMAKAQTASFWTTALNWSASGWNTDIWLIENGNLPVFHGMTISVTEVLLSPAHLTLNIGDSERLIFTVIPENATNKSVTWTSSKPAVALVDATGNVTGINVGAATITVAAGDGGFTADCAVTVTGMTDSDIAEVPLTQVYPNPTNGLLTLSFATEGHYNIAVCDASGKVLMRQTAAGMITQVDVSSLPAGVYMLLTDDGKRQSTTKIVKN